MMTRAKAQRTPSLEKIAKFFSLRAWHLGAKNFLKVVLLNILSVRIQYGYLLQIWIGVDPDPNNSIPNIDMSDTHSRRTP